MREDRTPRVRLTANRNYWDTDRGPFLQEIIFRNDLSPQQALELVCTTDGEVDMVTEVPPSAAARVEKSEHARLVSIDAVRSIAGIINRDAEDLPLADKRARIALNLAINRKRLVQEAMFGYADPLASLTPPSAVTFVHRLSPYSHDPVRAAELWREAGASAGRPLRIAAPEEMEKLAARVASDLIEALGIGCEVIVYRGAEKLESRRRLAQREQPREWDVLIFEQGAQSSDAPPLEVHRAFVGETGELRAGPVVPEFEELYKELVNKTSPIALSHLSYKIDQFVQEEALALFLCAPHALYAVNQYVEFEPYRTTFELADCKVSEKHWSRR